VNIATIFFKIGFRNSGVLKVTGGLSSDSCPAAFSVLSELVRKTV